MPFLLCSPYLGPQSSSCPKKFCCVKDFTPLAQKVKAVLLSRQINQRKALQASPPACSYTISDSQTGFATEMLTISFLCHGMPKQTQYRSSLCVCAHLFIPTFLLMGECDKKAVQISEVYTQLLCWTLPASYTSSPSLFARCEQDTSERS